MTTLIGRRGARGGETGVPRACPVCGVDMDGRRRQARYCSGACRAEASRLRRLLDGEQVDGWRSVMDRVAALRETAQIDRQEPYNGRDK